MRRHNTTLLALTLGTLLASCGGSWNPNYDGAGNEFVITATIDRVIRDDSVFVTDVTVLQAHGKASDWFTTSATFWNGDQDHTEIHDHYHDGGMWYSKQEVGQVYDMNHQPRPLTGLAPHQKARITGKIRADSNGEETSYRAVFDQLEVLAP